MIERKVRRNMFVELFEDKPFQGFGEDVQRRIRQIVRRGLSTSFVFVDG